MAMFSVDADAAQQTDRLQRPAGLPLPARARDGGPDVDALHRRGPRPVLRIRHQRDGQSARIERERTPRSGVGRRLHPPPARRPGVHPGSRHQDLGLPESDGGLHHSGGPSVRVRLQRRPATGGRHGIPPGLPIPVDPAPQTQRSYSHRDGVTRETSFEHTLNGVRNRFGGVRIWLGDHPYAKELASLGLPKRAMLNSSADHVQMTFGDAQEIS